MLGSSLIRFEPDDGKKIPLILIHGVHGTERKNGQSINSPTDYWGALLYNSPVTNFRKEYVVYLFQYYSDEVPVLNLGIELGREIDRKIPDRPYVIVAHSMGGLIAKNFMAHYNHRTGNWNGKIGGETALGLITLATPHHGTPGANDTAALKKYFTDDSWERYFRAVNFLYWNKSSGFRSPPARSSTAPNRSDLRWDNYDLKLNSDINSQLSDTNRIFKRFADKVIIYAGMLDPVMPDLNRKTFENDHTMLTFADGVLYYGLNQSFGKTDGLVPYKSALFCESDLAIFTPGSIPPNFVCSSLYRVRRFEFGAANATPVPPDVKTLSITRTKRGFDHKDMFENSLVIEKVRRDLLDFAKLVRTNIPPPKFEFPDMPTLFLLDVSDSMNEQDKITQAKNAGLSAIGEMQENRRRSQDNSNVAIWTFGGECSPSNIKRLLPFTNNLSQAENTFRRGIARPAGLTPLHTAIDLSVDEMTNYLASRPNLAEARIVVLTDGLNTCSEQIRPRGVYSQSQTTVYKKVKFYCIGFNIPPGSKEERDLQYLASASGGKYFSARNAAQLNRVFQKVIRVYIPKISGNGGTDGGTRAIVNRDFENALQIWTIYIKNNPTDPNGFYNLALVCEATERYKCAVENYNQYLKLLANAPDANEIESRIEKLEEDHRDETQYYIEVLRSDLDYLKEYYKRLFGLKNDELAQEFAGFVAEKGAFYRNLPEILEIRSTRIERNANDFADSLDFLNRRVGSPSFDRDAVSLLTVPISHLEELIERIEEFKAKN